MLTFTIKAKNSTIHYIKIVIATNGVQYTDMGCVARFGTICTI